MLQASCRLRLRIVLFGVAALGVLGILAVPPMQRRYAGKRLTGWLGVLVAEEKNEPP